MRQKELNDRGSREERNIESNSRKTAIKRKEVISHRNSVKAMILKKKKNETKRAGENWVKRWINKRNEGGVINQCLLTCKIADKRGKVGVSLHLIGDEGGGEEVQIEKCEWQIFWCFITALEFLMNFDNFSSGMDAWKVYKTQICRFAFAGLIIENCRYCKWYWCGNLHQSVELKKCGLVYCTPPPHTSFIQKARIRLFAINFYIF